MSKLAGIVRDRYGRVAIFGDEVFLNEKAIELVRTVVNSQKNKGSIKKLEGKPLDVPSDDTKVGRIVRDKLGRIVIDNDLFFDKNAIDDIRKEVVAQWQQRTLQQQETV